MGFGKPTKYWMLDQSQARPNSWDVSVSEASEEYKNRMVIFADLYIFVSKLRPVISLDVTIDLTRPLDFLERDELAINHKRRTSQLWL